MTTDFQHRRSIRLPEYDYSQPGAYYVTIVTHNRIPHFGQIINAKMVLNNIGKMVEAVWLEIPFHFRNVNVDTFVIMPNHIHGIIEIDLEVPILGADPRDIIRPVGTGSNDIIQPVGAGPRACPQTQPKRSEENTCLGKIPSLPQIVNHFKSFSTHQYIIGVQQNGWAPFDKRFWQRNYYEHVIRNDRDYESIYEYIQSNPMNWLKDEEFPK